MSGTGSLSGRLGRRLVVAAVAFVSIAGGCGGPDPIREAGHPGNDGAGRPGGETSRTAPENTVDRPSVGAASPTDPPSPIRFVDRTPQSGVESFRYYGGPSSNCRMTEQNGGGVAVFDFDRDGVPDLFFSNGSRFERPATGGDTQRLFRGLGQFRFEDVAEASGLRAYGFGQGVAAADYDNDGFLDLFVACYGQDRLWHNNGDGTFSETTREAGIPDENRWGASAAFADFDDDGDLDLFVVNYVDWSPDEPPCYSQHRPPVKISCSPTTRKGQSSFLYRNEGDCRFEEVGGAAGVAVGENSKGLALAVADLDGDDRLDVYVANDTTPNHLFRNLGGLRFADEAVRRGAAFSADGVAGAGMGVGVSDFDGDGRFDIAVTNFLNQPIDLFQNLGDAGFRPANEETGLDGPSRPMLSFGIVFADFDLDGWPDLFVANGHIWDFSRLKDSGYPYRMTQQIFRNVGGTRFQDVSRACGPYFERPLLGRAAAVGDLDDDGDLDIVVCHNDEPPALLENTSDRARQGIRLRLVGTQAARQPLGIRVRWKQGDRAGVSWMSSGGSFQAGSEALVVLPISGDQPMERLEVHWGPNRVERLSILPPGDSVVVVEGASAYRSE